jgi:peroxiredoxin Q/BCP
VIVVNQKKAKAARRVAAVQAPKTRRESSSFWRSWKGGLVALAAAALIAGSFVVPKLVNSSTPSAGAEHAMAMGSKQGAGLPVGSAVPSFTGRDVMTGKTISSRSLYNHKTLLFFSEGVMCQACFEQIQGLQQFGADLNQRGIQLVSITPDSPDELKQAIGQYGITTPMISDASRSMSEAFNTLGQGMHSDTPGHAFALIDKGRVLWYRDYWLAPYHSMYVQPKQLLADIPS